MTRGQGLHFLRRQIQRQDDIPYPWGKDDILKKSRRDDTFVTHHRKEPHPPLKDAIFSADECNEKMASFAERDYLW